MTTLQFKWYAFSELSVEQLYALLKMRSEIFVVEQTCVYLDPDGKDPQALHLLGTQDNKLMAYLRLFPPTPETGNELIFGRVVTDFSARRLGYGKLLLQQMLSYCETHYPQHAINCSAQLRLQHFYESFGFKTIGEPYDEDGILHIAMKRNPAS